MRKATRDWVRKAEADYRGALRLASAREPFHDLVAFHCQQSAEKYLKAMLEELGQHIPKTHALDDLLSLLLPSHGTLASIQRGLLFLTDFCRRSALPGDGNEQARSRIRRALGCQGA